MATYNIKVVVEYQYEVEANSKDEAEKQGWEYEDYLWAGEVYSIDVEPVSETLEDLED